MIPPNLQDPLLNVLWQAHTLIGAVGLAAILSLAFFGVTAIIAFSERNTDRYRHAANAPFFRNFSTLVDFAILDPILLVMIVQSSNVMASLPSFLKSTSATNTYLFAKATAIYVERFGSWIPGAVLMLIAAIAWTVYSLSLKRKQSLVVRLQSMSASGAYIGFMTTLLMYVVLTYFYRAAICTLYILDVTRGGFVLDEPVWDFGLGSVSRFQLGFSLVVAILAVIVVIFAIHDMWLFRRGRRRLRVVAVASALALGATTVFLATLVGVHDNLVRVLDREMLSLAASLKDSGSISASRSLSTLAGYSTWTLELGQSISVVLSQLGAVLATAFSGNIVRILRRSFNSEPHIISSNLKQGDGSSQKLLTKRRR